MKCSFEQWPLLTRRLLFSASHLCGRHIHHSIPAFITAINKQVFVHMQIPAALTLFFASHEQHRNGKIAILFVISFHQRLFLGSSFGKYLFSLQVLRQLLCRL